MGVATSAGVVLGLYPYFTFAGLLTAALAWASGGALGSGRLADIGPDPVRTGIVATIVVAISVILGAAATRAFRRR